MLSILIPTYNHKCVELVFELTRQIEALGIDAEIVVADDGSTDMNVVAENSIIEDIDGCRYIVNVSNIGIAKTRNLLMRSAKYDSMLFLDSDVFPKNDDFLLQYLRHAQDADVIVGGLDYRRGDKALSNPLRLRYGVAREVVSPERRALHPYDSFLSSNFMVNRKVADTLRFDETFDRYGHEDTLFGISLKLTGRSIAHIDAPVYHDDTDSSEQYLEKVRVSIQSLCMHRDELVGCSRLLRTYERMDALHLTGTARRVFRHFKSQMEKNLLSQKPSLFLLNIYKVAYMSSVMKLYSASSK